MYTLGIDIGSSSSKAVILKGTKPQWIIKTASDEKCSIIWLLVNSTVGYIIYMILSDFYQYYLI